MIEKPADIIWHIIGEELGKGSSIIDPTLDAEGKTGHQRAIDAHPDWKMAFTVNKKINSKKLIEGIAKESKLFPFFKGDKLSFNSVLDTYSSSDFEIKDSDIISYKFNRTRIEDIKTKVILNYHLDYATNEFTKSTKSTIEEDTAAEFFTDYSNDYYGIEGEQGDDPIEAKYIRKQETAEKLQRFLLAWYCNQHNTCKVRLPLSYLYAEVGDITAFPTLLNGRKAYGEDYSLEGYFATGATVRNGQEILPYWMVMGASKTLEYVVLDLIQMHNLTDEITNLAPEANAGVDQQGTFENTITLDGSGSSDPEGDNLTYLWTSPDLITLSDNTAEKPTFMMPENTNELAVSLEFSLIVNDGQDNSNPDWVTIYNNPPTAQEIWLSKTPEVTKMYLVNPAHLVSFYFNEEYNDDNVYIQSTGDSGNTPVWNAVIEIDEMTGGNMVLTINPTEDYGIPITTMDIGVTGTGDLARWTIYLIKEDNVTVGSTIVVTYSPVPVL